ncbi:SMI1/KNR4 family protein [Paractinoplanes toevensis]|uniref:Knr4/Smi1-like domain-containing protein n=1 Tax=Paractinoplanes toevensis TaxID=571911 RepID=A0A920BNV6_9ACTN|nr:SMI1/KNR4 family protein [Actinoplanes toevensis]GIM96237.1 hypothetical protein Ato02nite_080300 [Actinoplanes toevensis]
MEDIVRDGGDGGSVDESWAVLVAGLQRYCPEVLAWIRPAASPDDLRLAEETLGRPLPADLVRWWQLADGMTKHTSLIPQSYTPYSVREALSDRRTWLEVSAHADRYEPDDYDECLAAPAGTGCSGWFLPQWLPVAGDDAGGTLFVDLRFGHANGCVSKMHTGWSSGPAVWTGVGAMLEEVAEAVRRDRKVRGFRIWVDAQGVDWDDDLWRWVHPGGRSGPDPEQLRHRYRALTAELRVGGFAEPSDDWPAAWIAATVKRNTEVLIVTAEAIAATEPGWDDEMWVAYNKQAGARYRGQSLADTGVGRGIRYDNTGGLDPTILSRYARAGLPDLADDIDVLGDRLLETSASFLDRRPAVYARIVDDGVVLADEIVSWWGILLALYWRQLPIRIRQLQTLRQT